MVATPARIGFVMDEWRRATATTALPKERYGDLARESEDPVETFFDNVADAQVIADERQALLSTERRRFSLVAGDSDDIVALDYSEAIPVAHFIDPERDMERLMLVCEIAVDLEKSEAALAVWG